MKNQKMLIKVNGGKYVKLTPEEFDKRKTRNPMTGNYNVLCLHGDVRVRYEEIGTISE